MSKPIQGSLFEEDYLLRTLGTLAYSPDVALTELVANGWDAGASRVEIQIPDDYEGGLTVEDDGIGMTARDFRKRWMTLGYNRARHQGVDAEFPAERASWRRRAYGRNGVGRHGLLCFGSKYTVETWRDGKAFRYVISTAKGKQPFVLLSQESYSKAGHGTRLSVTVSRRLPYADRIREVLSARFLHDPQFRLFVNGKSVPLMEHSGLIDRAALTISEGKTADVFFIDSTLAGRTTMHQGVAFWVGSRLVGEPSWIVGKLTLIDGRTRIAKRYTAVVKSDDLFDEVLPDYSAFRDSDTTQALYEQVCEYVGKMLKQVAAERVEETKASVLSEHKEALGDLQPLARLEVTEFIGEIAARQPMMSAETMTVAVEAIINLERSRSGVSLLEKLAKLSQEDVEGLDKLLSEWSVRDALTVLDEIDRRLVVIEAIKKLSADNTVDEVHTLHPLVTQARWLFGPEFDSAEYVSNVSLANAIRQVFGERVDEKAFLNPRKRPDLVILSDATLSAVCTECYDDSKGLQTIRDLLVIELKRGEATISRDNVHQASDYVEDLLKCGHLDGRPFIRAFVVGHRISDKVEPTRAIGENPISARIDVATYGQLVRTGAKRLFSLREQLKSRYEEISGVDLFKRTSDNDVTDRQMRLVDPPSHQKQNGGRTHSPNNA